jgi:histidyl-tRNA synthetase
MIGKVKGTQDFLELSLYNEIVRRFRVHVAEYRFTQIQTPLLEQVSLFAKTLGEYTDVISKEMFVIQQKDIEKIPEDRICLRPEATAPTMRVFLEHHIEKTPWKVFMIGPMFRYERPQKGRLRQFHQCNIEIIGESSIAGDVELLLLLDRFFHEKLHMNNYALVINFLGCQEDRKKHRDALAQFLNNIDTNELCANCLVRREHNILRVFDCKETRCQEWYKKAPKTTDCLCENCISEWHFLQKGLQLLSISASHNPLLVRGLDYYTKTVFEFVGHTEVGAQNAFAGGGRYDHLAEILGSKQVVPSLGAGIGIERLLLLLEPYKEIMLQKTKEKCVIIVPYEKEQHMLALLYADEIRAVGVKAEILFEGSVKSKMRKADKFGATNLLFLGPEEQASQTVMVKDMMSGKQEQVKMSELVAHLLRLS